MGAGAIDSCGEDVWENVSSGDARTIAVSARTVNGIRLQLFIRSFIFIEAKVYPVEIRLSPPGENQYHTLRIAARRGCKRIAAAVI
jgi:hypothetical protein